MDPWPTALWATVSGVVWCSLLVYLGFMVGDQWAVIGRYLAVYGRWMMAVLGLLAVVYIGLRIWRWRRPGEASEEAAKTP